MRRGSISLLFAAFGVFAAAGGTAADAKTYQGYGYGSHTKARYQTSYRKSGYTKKAYGRGYSKGYGAKRTYSKKSYGYNQRGNYGRKTYGRSAQRGYGYRPRVAYGGGGGGGGGASTSCLTSETRALLGRIQAQFGPVQVISTCRPGARIAGSGRPSLHASGRAVDFRVPGGRKGQVVQWLIANHRSGGTMTYSDMDHVHVDVGARFVALGRPSGH